MRIARRWHNESSKRSVFDSILDKVMGDLFSGNDRPKRRPRSAARPAAKPRRQNFALEAIEPRLLLSADISYTYSAADLAKFNDGDLANNHYQLLIVGNGAGADSLQLKAEDGSLLGSGTTTLGAGLNKVSLTGFEGLGDQLTIDLSGISGQDLTKYDLQITMDGKGVIPLIGQDDKVSIIGDGGYGLHSF